MGKRKTNDEFLKELFLKNKHFANCEFEVLGQYVNIHTPIQCRCKIDGYTWYSEPNHLLQGHGCPVCGGKRVIKGYNDVATTHPELLYLFKDKKEAEAVSIGSGKKVTLVCQDCGHDKKILLSNYLKNGIGCQYCSDGISYPEKFIRAFVVQCNPDIMDCQYQPDWAKPYFYDIYTQLNGVEYIIEADGAWHYVDNTLSGQTVEEVRQKDKLKDDLALQHGIKVIRIDCMESNKNYISKSILNSELSNIIRMDSIDWNYCEKMAQCNLAKVICDFYNKSDIKDSIYLAKIFNINRTTVEKCLHIGNDVGWCSFNTRPKEKEVRVLNKDKIVLYTFESIKKCASELEKIYHINFSRPCISRACKYNKYTHRGFYFEYV